MEHDNSNLYEKFKGLIGEIVSGRNPLCTSQTSDYYG